MRKPKTAELCYSPTMKTSEKACLATYGRPYKKNPKAHDLVQDWAHIFGWLRREFSNRNYPVLPTLANIERLREFCELQLKMLSPDWGTAEFNKATDKRMEEMNTVATIGLTFPDKILPLLNQLKVCLESGDTKYFRDLADAIESVNQVKHGDIKDKIRLWLIQRCLSHPLDGSDIRPYRLTGKIGLQEEIHEVLKYKVDKVWLHKTCKELGISFGRKGRPNKVVNTP